MVPTVIEGSADSEGDLDQWLKLNTKYAEKWPYITRKGDAAASIHFTVATRG